MKILWIVNTIFPYPAKQIGLKEDCFGGWLNGLADNLKKEQGIELAIATVYNCDEIKKYNDTNITYYLIPGGLSLKYNKEQEKYWRDVQKEFKPDLVHIHGTEYAHGLAFINANLTTKVVVSIQGLVYRYADVYLANIPEKEVIRNITFRDIVKRDNLFQAKRKFEKRGEIEKQIIKKADAIIGRTTWDYANAKAIKPDLVYYKCNETLRGSFYQDEWNINNIERHSIFVSQGSYPIKGLHYMLETLKILKEKYPDVKLYVGGTNITDTSTLKAKIKLSGYGKYLRKLINKYELSENIIFTGLLDEKKMKEKFLKSNVFVLPSAIENSSNSLGEAMILGMPCVATNTGGTTDILEHNKEGFLYPYTEPAICAEYINRFFENDELAIKMGKNARKTAMERHNEKSNVEDTIKIYKTIIESEE